MFMRFATMATALTFAMPAVAQDSDAEVLFDLLMLPDIIEIMRQEGVSYGDTIGQDLFGGPPSAEWAATVEQIYDYERMENMVRTDFAASLDDADLSPIIAFFGSDQGQMIVGLEVSARRALLDDAVEAASEDGRDILARPLNESFVVRLLADGMDDDSVLHRLFEDQLKGRSFPEADNIVWIWEVDSSRAPAITIQVTSSGCWLDPLRGTKAYESSAHIDAVEGKPQKS